MALTLRRLAMLVTQHCLEHPEDLDCPVVLLSPESGVPASKATAVDFGCRFRPFENDPEVGETLSARHAKATDEKVVALWP